MVGTFLTSSELFLLSAEPAALIIIFVPIFCVTSLQLMSGCPWVFEMYGKRTVTGRGQ
jgi:hypothetical protein